MAQNRQFSTYRHCWDSLPTGKSLTFDVFLELIKSDKSLRERVARVREGEQKAALLPAASPSALFEGRRSARGTWQHSGLIGVDYDHVPDAEQFRADAVRNSSCVGAFVSPSGDGVKAFFAVDPVPTTADHHKQAFKQVTDRLAGQDFIDFGANDVSRLCFFSHDPDAFCRSVSPLNVAYTTPQTHKPNSYVPSKEEERRIISALDALPNKEYETWFRVGMALKSYFRNSPNGLEVWKRWSAKNNYPNYDEDDCVARWESFDPDGGVTLGTLYYLAKQHSRRVNLA